MGSNKAEGLRTVAASWTTALTRPWWKWPAAVIIPVPDDPPKLPCSSCGSKQIRGHVRPRNRRTVVLVDIYPV